MTRTSYLRVYLPEDQFSDAERDSWRGGADPTDVSAAQPSRGWAVRVALSARVPDSLLEGAFVRRRGGVTLVCPWRLRLRMLTGLLTFRESLPGEIADAFVPTDSALEATRQLSSLGARRSHILHANWHVPLHWFVPFSDTDRVLCEDAAGLRIRYETSLSEARSRTAGALSVLEETLLDNGVIDPCRELMSWLEQWESDGLLELDYSSVALGFSDEAIVDDHSAAEVEDCLDALAASDLFRAAGTFEDLMERWAGARAAEAAN